MVKLASMALLSRAFGVAISRYRPAFSFLRLSHPVNLKLFGLVLVPEAVKLPRIGTYAVQRRLVEFLRDAFWQLCPRRRPFITCSMVNVTAASTLTVNRTCVPVRRPLAPIELGPRGAARKCRGESDNPVTAGV